MHQLSAMQTKAITVQVTMNPLKYSYLAFLVLLCVGFSFGHRILLDTKNNDPEKTNQTHENKALEQTHGVAGSNGGSGVGRGIDDQKCQGGQCQQPCQGEPCQGEGGVNIPGIQIPGIEIPPIQFPGISIPIPIPQFPFPTQPSPCPPQSCHPDPCPPQNCHPDTCPPQHCHPSSCPPYNCQPCGQENVTAKPNEFKKNDDDQNEMKKNPEGEAKRANPDKDDLVDPKTQSFKSDEEARLAHVHH